MSRQAYRVQLIRGSWRSVKDMDDKAHAARMDAEATFDEAER
jgi:hypothetical protein